MKSVISVFALALLLISCTKEPLNNLSEDDSRIYITNHDSTVSFSTYKTFSIVDTVSVIDNGRVSSRELTAWDAAFLNELRAAMEARGFQYVARNQDPDLGINVSRIFNTYTGIYDYNDYWGGYYDYYDPFYWGYGGSSYYFPSYYGVYEVTEGAVSVDLLDLKNASSTNTIRGVWNGLIRGSGIFSGSNIGEQVQALFNQSPYLVTNE